MLPRTVIHAKSKENIYLVNVKVLIYLSNDLYVLTNLRTYTNSHPCIAQIYLYMQYLWMLGHICSIYVINNWLAEGLSHLNFYQLSGMRLLLYPSIYLGALQKHNLCNKNHQEHLKAFLTMYKLHYLRQFSLFNYTLIFFHGHCDLSFLVSVKIRC